MGDIVQFGSNSNNSNFSNYSGTNNNSSTSTVDDLVYANEVSIRHTHLQ